ncbi:hypothetical protein DL89DRAFT_268331 [Linderina pennispora]|uniref:CBM1 domain-containing protein n=1 Tax=Linderina pennispora TaxID=61395 RepID=A0A1Y1W4P6_9FUNG|nr:uncharacterized protein DL89DRAFT_268331 [Linderina pennispora]ORX68499.1 hypothetical protein DL89DRAFT_268331 [Linderina pennispora]
MWFRAVICVSILISFAGFAAAWRDNDDFGHRSDYRGHPPYDDCGGGGRERDRWLCNNAGMQHMCLSMAAYLLITMHCICQ